MYILKRILKSASKRVHSIFDSFFWEIYKRSCDGLQRIGESNSQCVIICNGPSLSSVDMDHISEIDTFAMNRSYLAYDDWGFVPTYYVCVNELVLDQFSNDIDISIWKSYISLLTPYSIQNHSISAFCCWKSIT